MTGWSASGSGDTRNSALPTGVLLIPAWPEVKGLGHESGHGAGMEVHPEPET